MRATALVLAAVLAAGCAADGTGESDLTAETTIESATERPTASSPIEGEAPVNDSDSDDASEVPAPTLAPAQPSDLVIWGTRDAYTFEETQAFGEFGPVLWGLVTTLHGTDQIEHGPGHEWVTWGPLWGGSLQVAGPHDTYGVTDLAAVDVVAIAAVIPTGEAVVFREVRWSLDELDAFKDDLYAEAPDNGVCYTTGFGGYGNLVRVVATQDIKLGDVPQDAVAVEVVDVCPTFVTKPAIIEG